MTGLFDGMNGAMGLFGGINQRMVPFTQNNQNALMGAGLELLGGGGYQGAARGFMTGGLADSQRRAQAAQGQMAQERLGMEQERLRMAQAEHQQRTTAAERMLKQQNQTDQWFQNNLPDYANAPDEVRMTALKAKMGAGAKPTSDMQEYELAKSQGYGGSFMDYQTELKKAGATNINMNNEQSKAAGFADRMIQSEQILRQTEEAGLSLYDRSAGGIPVIGNYLTTDDFKSFEQAKRDFVNAVLRRESGAVISPSEFDNADKQYFPQPGDSQEVIAQKRRNREVAIQGIARAAGGTYTPATIPADNGGDWQTLPNGVKIREKR